MIKNNRDYNKLRTETVALNKERGLCAKEIADILNIDRRVTSKYLKEAGVKFSRNNKANINSNIFNIIDTEEKAYWLGFLYADGYISDNNNLELSLKLSDEEHIKKFKSFLSFEGKIYKDSFRVRLCVKDKDICSDLIRLGCTPRKSLTLVFPNHINEDLLPYFIRGYFEGDGYISKVSPIRMSLLGTESFLDSLINKLKITTKVRACKSKAFYIEIFGDNARILANTIYKNASIFLDRKYQIYNEQKIKYEYKGSKTEGVC